jgi:hypothetical protein
VKVEARPIRGALERFMTTQAWLLADERGCEFKYRVAS